MSKWATIRAGANGLTVVGMARATLHKKLLSLATDYDHVVIDGPPRIHAIAKSVVLAADVVVVPVQPPPTDVWSTSETVDLIREDRVFNERLRPLLVVNRSIANTTVARDVRSTLGSLDVPVLGAGLSQRVVFAEALATGQTVATRELDAVVDELTALA